MGRMCCVLACPSRQNVPLHSFPKDRSRFIAWKNAVWSKKVEHLTDDRLKKLFVCYKHFKEDDYTGSPRLLILQRNAVPSLSLPTQETIQNENSEVNQKEMPESKTMEEEFTMTEYLKPNPSPLAVSANTEPASHELAVSETLELIPSTLSIAENSDKTQKEQDIMSTPQVYRKNTKKIQILPKHDSAKKLSPKCQDLYCIIKQLQRRKQTYCKGIYTVKML